MKNFFISILFLFTAIISWAKPAPDSWVILLYQDADDYQLEQDICMDFNEAEKVGSTANITILSQLDRYDGSYEGDGNWSSTRRYYLKQDDDFEKTGSKLLMDLGEKDMSQKETLVDFVTWGIQNYEAEHYVLILSDHGMGWPGGWTDPVPDETDMLTVDDMEEAFKTIIAKTGIKKLDLIGFDACLMGHYEVFSTLAPYADYAVASQETEPGIGWAYGGFLESLKKNPSMPPGELAGEIINSYINKDESVINPKLRGEGVTAEEMAEWLGGDITLSAIDLNAFQNLEKEFNYFLGLLKKEDQTIVAKARSYAQSFTNVFDEDHPSPYIDLGHFIKILKKEGKNKKMLTAIDSLLKSMNKSVIAEKHGPLKPGSSGISIHFPNSNIYEADWGGAVSYTYMVPSFAKRSLWDDFLLYHYTSSDFSAVARPEESAKEEPAAVPAADAVVAAPGKGEISITKIKTENAVVKTGTGATLDIESVITGNNIAYIYIFTGYYDASSDSLLIADKDFIEADNTMAVDGVNYPDWQSSGPEIEMIFEWEPILFYLDDGKNEEFCLLEPVDYGATADQAVYMVTGTYQSKDGTDTRHSIIYFDGKGQMINMYGFKGTTGIGAPYEIKPAIGDQFTIQEDWIQNDPETGEPQIYHYNGGTITFSKTKLEWYDYDAPPGDYVLGYIAVDFDGNIAEEYIEVVVSE